MFNNGFEKITNGYLHLTQWLLNKTLIGIGLFFCHSSGNCAIYSSTRRRAFVPDEDQGYLIGIASLPDAASLERTVQIDKKIEEIAM